SQARLTAELRDLKTTADPTAFDLPQGYSQITQEQVKQYMQTLATVFQFVMQGVNNANAGGASASPAASPSASPSTSASPGRTP
ncbi:MAG: hypothetical protein LC746_07805, partial [Acidobacteria bacterium]|nr:hypothetical protein [Acidobacteriota bacterium]